MGPEQVFQIANVVALTGWLVLLFVPSNRAVVEGVARALVPSLLSIAYAVILIPFLSAAASDRWKCWLHYLTFDLLAGAWEVTTAQDEAISHCPLIPCLVFTFLLRPIGFLGFLILRWTLSRRD